MFMLWSLHHQENGGLRFHEVFRARSRALVGQGQLQPPRVEDHDPPVPELRLGEGHQDVRVVPVEPSVNGVQLAFRPEGHAYVSELAHLARERLFQGRPHRQFQGRGWGHLPLGLREGIDAVPPQVSRRIERWLLDEVRVTLSETGEFGENGQLLCPVLIREVQQADQRHALGGEGRGDQSPPDAVRELCFLGALLHLLRERQAIHGGHAVEAIAGRPLREEVVAAVLPPLKQVC
mmetsp:Transcript_846/g.2518  ORF Transcript_846/g.2518 Transcript_846/m.2518 type:complete len:235 (+) Transcript_846:839-1543(+)